MTASAGVYLAAWLVGLVIAPASPAAFAPAAEVHAFFAAHGGAALLQSGLVHGVAGLALAGWVLAVGRPGRQLRRSVTAAGLTAAALSLVQAAAMAVLVAQADAGRVTATDAAFDLINRLDSAKLLALGLLVAVVGLAGRGTLPAWLRHLGGGLAVLLPVSGAAFLVPSPPLTALLYVSLPALLVWVAAVTVVLRRATARGVR
ncbi:hypothetical protein [Georgenia thermotolerans]|uniref:DUF4386 family protein n=1 Tax=Georgenia thermotolerans TaxID=527326 RepID=A0A7J5US38_9MICO|nr:hypothetical protein [Georgenia thermotolerans]KAE8765285.1 hypothetical protein GB883_04375 [Georgenia thermotolerans]